MGLNGKRRTHYYKHCVQPFSSEEKLECHMDRVCYNVVGRIRVLPKQDERWTQSEDAKMMYKEKYVLLHAMHILNVV